MGDNKTGEQLRSLVSDMKTRSPQEVMGAAATRSLMGSVVTAAVAMIGLLMLSTLAIFFIVGPPAIREKIEPKPVASAAASGTLIAEPDKAAETDSSAPDVEPTGGQPAAGQMNSKSATEPDPVQAMGIGETKDPDSNTDSLDNRLDDLLQGLE